MVSALRKSHGVSLSKEELLAEVLSRNCFADIRQGQRALLQHFKEIFRISMTSCRLRIPCEIELNDAWFFNFIILITLLVC